MRVQLLGCTTPKRSISLTRGLSQSLSRVLDPDAHNEIEYRKEETVDHGKDVLSAETGKLQYHYLTYQEQGNLDRYHYDIDGHPCRFFTINYSEYTGYELEYGAYHYDDSTPESKRVLFHKDSYWDPHSEQRCLRYQIDYAAYDK